MEITKKVCDICGDGLDKYTGWPSKIVLGEKEIPEVCSTCKQVIIEVISDRVRQGELPKQQKEETLSILA